MKRSIESGRRRPSVAMALALALVLVAGAVRRAEAGAPMRLAAVPATAAAAATPAASSTSRSAAASAPSAEFVARMGTCAECHDPETSTLAGSVHGQHGVSCSDCHGGDPKTEVQEESMSPSKGYVGRPGRKDIPAFCARCHADPKKMGTSELPTDQYAQYRASFHGKKVLQEGDTTAAVCTDCHGVHDTLSPKDPRSPTYRANIPATCNRCHGDDLKMNVYAIPTDQYKKWRSSAHGRAVIEKKDLSAAVCTDCHGKHDIVNPEDPHSRVHHANIVKTCARCHGDEALMARHKRSSRAPADYLAGIHGVALFKHGNSAAPVCTTCHGSHGALPPGVKTAAMVCGKCHSRSEEFYDKSPHRWVKGFKGCIECHSNHKITEPGSHMFVSTCEPCHPVDSPALELGKFLKETFDKASFTVDAAAEELESARGYGFPLNGAQDAVREGKQSRIEVVPALHTLDKREAERFLAKSQETLRTVHDGVEQIRLRVRNRNLSLLIVFVAIVGAILLFKAKLDRLDTEE